MTGGSERLWIIICVKINHSNPVTFVRPKSRRKYIYEVNGTLNFLFIGLCLIKILLTWIYYWTHKRNILSLQTIFSNIVHWIHSINIKYFKEKIFTQKTRSIRRLLLYKETLINSSLTSKGAIIGQFTTEVYENFVFIINCFEQNKTLRFVRVDWKF